MKRRGVLTEEEFARLKSRVIEGDQESGQESAVEKIGEVAGIYANVLKVSFVVGLILVPLFCKDFLDRNGT